MMCFPKIVGFPPTSSICSIGVFHDFHFHHPFWGYLYPLFFGVQHPAISNQGTRCKGFAAAVLVQQWHYDHPSPRGADGRLDSYIGGIYQPVLENVCMYIILVIFSKKSEDWKRHTCIYIDVHVNEYISYICRDSGRTYNTRILYTTSLVSCQMWIPPSELLPRLCHFFPASFNQSPVRTGVTWNPCGIFMMWARSPNLSYRVVDLALNRSQPLETNI